MKIKYHLTAADLYNANYYLSWKSPEKKRHRIITTLLPVLVILALIFYDVWNENLINDKRQVLWLSITFGFIVVASIIFTPFIQKGATDNKTNKFLRKDNNSAILNPRELEINENGITEVGGDEERNYSWQTIIKTREVNQYIYIYLTPITVIILRKDMFDSEKDFENTKALIKEKTI